VIFLRDPLAHPEPLIRRVYAYVAYRIGDGADAEDVTSDVFERALRYRESYDRGKGEPAAWLIGIARRSVDSHLAARPPVPTELADAAAPGDLEEAASTRLDLHRALGTLDERDRELLALRYGADLSARQIGELLEQRTNTVEVALHRALGRLRGALERDDPPPAEAPVLKPEVSP
jgi:RNA polymerase sigma factor (sigma-70 family)